MAIELTIDSKEFNKALNVYFASTQKTLSEILNQRAFNIAARAMDMTPPAPGQEQAERNRVAAYLRQPISTRIKLAKSGKRKGRIIRRGARRNQLQRVHLILQAKRARAGAKGLYGERMRQLSGEFKRRAATSVGFLKSPYIRVIKGLMPFVRFRKVATRWGRISVWPGSAGGGRVNPAKPGFNPLAEFAVNWRLGGGGKRGAAIASRVINAAFNAEAAEMRRHVAERMQKDADRVNAK